MKRIAGILVAVLMVCVFAVGCAGEAGSSDNAITVSAAATAEVAPDTAGIAFTLSAAGGDEAAARAAGNDAVSVVKARLRTLGLTDADISAGDVVLAERYSEGGVIEVPSGYEDEFGNWVETVEEIYVGGYSSVDGYNASVRVQVSNIPVDRLGQAIRESVDAGASEFGGLVYSLESREAAYQAALADAVDAAHAKAESLASASGVYVGRVVNLVEMSSVPEEVAQEANAGAIDPSNPATFELIPDNVPVTASVTVSYAIS